MYICNYKTCRNRLCLERLLQANARLNVAYLLREQFEQLWSSHRSRRRPLVLRQLAGAIAGTGPGPLQKFARMIERHWDGIAAYCKPENKVALGFVEGFNNKIRVIQRRAFGLRDEEYLALKIRTLGLPEL